MKIVQINYSDHVEIYIRDDVGINIHAYTFDNKEQVRAFLQGWRCCQSVINGRVQSLPQTVDEVIKA